MTRPATPPQRYRVCFVCSGNICRSPMAAIILRGLASRVPLGSPPASSTLADRISVDSAGTGPWHEGEPMDTRARAALEAAGYHDSGHVAHQLRTSELADYDLLVALDRRHLQTLRSLAGPGTHSGRMVLLRRYGTDGKLDVADPYYGDDAEFRVCLKTIEDACRGLVRHLTARLENAS